MNDPIVQTALAHDLRALTTAAAALHVGAHPDDEDSGLLAWLSLGQGVRSVYWSATRGEGGQNRAGDEAGDALGIRALGEPRRPADRRRRGRLRPVPRLRVQQEPSSPTCESRPATSPRGSGRVILRRSSMGCHSHYVRSSRWRLMACTRWRTSPQPHGYLGGLHGAADRGRRARPPAGLIQAPHLISEASIGTSTPDRLDNAPHVCHREAGRD